jgi:tetratricopeptide (TPR) repeat protein
MIQDDLGNAYCDRSKGDWAENMEKAIAAFQSALQGYTDEAFREDWARTQNNLATIYSDRTRGDQAENLEQAIACCENALQVYTRQVFPEDWAMVQTNLGAAYRKRIRGDKAENLEAAIRCYKAALEEYTREGLRVDWAGVQNNLGNAYRERIQGDRAENLEQALSCFNTALEVYNTSESLRQDWAMIQNNLALTYYEQGQIESAIACFRAALEICTPSTFPYDCLQYGGNLGDKAFAAGLWVEAIEGYRVAIEVIEQTRAWVSTEARRQEILQEYIDLYENIVQACINSKQLDKAVEYVERSKARKLVELLANCDLYPKGEIPADILNELERLHREIPAQDRLLEIVQQKVVRGTGEDRSRIKPRLQQFAA